MTTAAPVKSPVTSYAQRVIDGEIVAGRLVRLACERHLRDLGRGAERGLRFDDAAAERAISFFSYLRHSKGEWAGQVFVLAPWQEFIVGSLFGWARADGTRRFRVAYIEVPRKNGKSLLAAGVGLLLAFFDKEAGAEVYACATKREQAKIVWGDAKAMVLRSPQLKRYINVLVSNLNQEASRSKFEPLGADVDGMDGLNIHGAIVDELHAHKQPRMWDVIDTATGARAQPLIFAITTAGYDQLSICYQQHDYSIKVLEGMMDDDSWFAYVATIDEGDDWRSPETWEKANPNYGVSVKVDDLERKCLHAQESPQRQNAFLRDHLNIWTEQSTRWLDMGVWDENAGDLTHAEMIAALKGRLCYAGVDLSNTVDLTCISLWFPSEDGSVDVLTYPFMPEDNVQERVRRDRAPYDLWARQGYMHTTPGNVIDYDWIRAFINDLAADYEIREVAIDPFNARQTLIQLNADGLRAMETRQGFLTLSAPTKELERLVVSRRLRHGGHPVLRWAASNVAVNTDPAGNIKPDKDKNNINGRIDPISSLVNAGARAIMHQEEKPSSYEDHGLEWLE